MVLFDVYLFAVVCVVKSFGSMFLMNTMLASGGYDWLIIPVGKRDEYMVALEKASVAGDIVPFTRFLSTI